MPAQSICGQSQSVRGSSHGSGAFKEAFFPFSFAEPWEKSEAFEREFQARSFLWLRALLLLLLEKFTTTLGLGTAPPLPSTGSKTSAF